MLLILAGVALATLTGQGNIIGNAENAVGKYNNSVADEQQLLNEIEKYFQNYLEGGNPPTPSEPVDENGLATENTTITTDEENVQIVIPKGFAPVILNGSNSTYSLPGQDGSVKEIIPYEQWSSITAEQINQGIVIVDSAITYTEGVPDFNEYVWVPIPNFMEDFKQNAWEGIYGTLNGVTTGKHPIATNPSNDIEKQNKYWDDSEKQEYQDMLDSVEHYKGFYIGRYEASIGNNIVQSKRNTYPRVNITQPEAIAACVNNTTESVHLIYGVEWDSVLNWLIGKAEISSAIVGKTKTMDIADIQNNSSSWGNYKNSSGDAALEPWRVHTLQNTGASEYWKANNIYDLAGNADEWTQERYSTGTVISVRGGASSYTMDDHSVAFRNTIGESLTNYVDSFRASFFVALDAGSDA